MRAANLVAETGQVKGQHSAVGDVVVFGVHLAQQVGLAHIPLKCWEEVAH